MQTNHQLIQTICTLAPYGVQVQYESGKILTIVPSLQGNINTKNEVSVHCAIELVVSKKAKLLLHSTSKLTEPILEGGKIPIMELAKIELTKHFREFDKNKGGAALKEFDFENSDLYLEDTRKDGKCCDLYFNYKEERWLFAIILGNTFSLMNVNRTKHLPIYEQFKLFNFMIAEGFNVFNLSEEYFTEKSTVKL